MNIARHDDMILAAVRKGPATATYVVRNRIRNNGRGPDLTTAQVLRRLKVLESRGIVQRVPSAYAVMLCWSICDDR